MLRALFRILLIVLISHLLGIIEFAKLVFGGPLVLLDSLVTMSPGFDFFCPVAFDGFYDFGLRWRKVDVNLTVRLLFPVYGPYLLAVVLDDGVVDPLFVIAV